MARIAFIGLAIWAAAWPRTSRRRGMTSAPSTCRRRAGGGEGGRVPARRQRRRGDGRGGGGGDHVPAGTHVERVYADAVFAAAPPSAILIDCSTIDVATARRVAEAAQAKGMMAVDAPVSGGSRRPRQHADLHGRRYAGSVRPGRAFPVRHGPGGDPCRRQRRGPGGEDLQQTCCSARR